MDKAPFSPLGFLGNFTAPSPGQTGTIGPMSEAKRRLYWKSFIVPSGRKFVFGLTKRIIWYTMGKKRADYLLKCTAERAIKSHPTNLYYVLNCIGNRGSLKPSFHWEVRSSQVCQFMVQCIQESVSTPSCTLTALVWLYRAAVVGRQCLQDLLCRLKNIQ